MSHYFYKAINSLGKTVRGKLPAESQGELIDTLSVMGLELVSCKLEKKQESFSFLSKVKPSRKVKKLKDFELRK